MKSYLKALLIFLAIVVVVLAIVLPLTLKKGSNNDTNTSTTSSTNTTTSISTSTKTSTSTTVNNGSTYLYAVLTGNSNTIVRYSLSDSTYINYYTFTDLVPKIITSDSSGNLYIGGINSSTNAKEIRKIVTSGSTPVQTTYSTSSLFTGSLVGMVYASDNNLYVIQNQPSLLLKVDSTGTATAVTVPFSWVAVKAIDFDSASNNLYVTDNGTGIAGSNTGFLAQIPISTPSTATKLVTKDLLYGLAVKNNNTFYVSFGTTTDTTPFYIMDNQGNLTKGVSNTTTSGQGSVIKLDRKYIGGDLLYINLINEKTIIYKALNPSPTGTYTNFATSLSSASVYLDFTLI